MKIVMLMGGLGNQMFQYAFGYALQKEINEEILYDISWFENVKNDKTTTTRDFQLLEFNISPKFSNNIEKETCIDEKRIKLSILPKFILKILHREKYKIKSNIIHENVINKFEPALFDIPNNKSAFYIGYFQNENYFIKYRKDILKAFSLKNDLNEQNKAILNKIKNCNSISLHIRRGDYLKYKNYQTCSIEYYNKAIEYIASKIDNPHFFLFSDDIEWVIKNLIPKYNYTIVDINTSETCYFDLELMKNCKHNIIANSSFSWWGAWLNDNKDKIVIAPHLWTLDSGNEDIVPQNWIRI